MILGRNNGDILAIFYHYIIVIAVIWTVIATYFSGDITLILWQYYGVITVILHQLFHLGKSIDFISVVNIHGHQYFPLLLIPVGLN